MCSVTNKMEMSPVVLFQFLIALIYSKSTHTSSEIVTPIIHTTEDEYPGTLTIEISNYTLHLSHQELPVHFTNTYFKQSKQVTENDFAGCVYDGDVEGFSSWSVSLALCNGIQGHFGDSDDKEHYYYIEPLDLMRENYPLNRPHLLYYPNQPTNSSFGICAGWLAKDSVLSKKRLEPKANQMFELGQKIVELVFVNDHAQHLYHRRKLPSVVLRNMEIVAHMNQLYREFNISIALVGVVTWTERDLIPLPRDLDPVQVLLNFRDYYDRIPGKLDCAMLISGRDFKENVVGLAYKSAMCYGSYSVGIIQDGHTDVDVVGATATHELGHILGMSHDDKNGRVCDCDDPTGKCIMAPVAPTSNPAVLWSNCSFNDMEKSIAMYPVTESCLYNEPSALATAPNSSPERSINSTGKHVCYTASTIVIALTIFIVQRLYLAR